MSYIITTTEPIKITRDATLYQTAHCGTLTYTITLPEEGQYMLQFKTVEFQYNQTNSRQTKITLNDKILASNSNPYQEMGYATAFDLYYNLIIENGILNINGAQSSSFSNNLIYIKISGNEGCIFSWSITKKTKVLDYNYYIGNNDIIAKDVFINNYSVEPVTFKYDDLFVGSVELTFTPSFYGMSFRNYGDSIGGTLQYSDSQGVMQNVEYQNYSKRYL